MSVEALESCLENVVLLDVEELSVVSALIGDLSGVLPVKALTEDLDLGELVPPSVTAAVSGASGDEPVAKATKWMSKKEGRKWWMKRVSSVNLAKNNGFAIEGHLVSGPDMVEEGEAVVVGWKNKAGENRCIAAMKVGEEKSGCVYAMDICEGAADMVKGKVGEIYGFKRLVWCDHDGVWRRSDEDSVGKIVYCPELAKKTRMRPDLKATIQVLCETDGVQIKGADE